jgi:hypothetical protein
VQKGSRNTRAFLFSNYCQKVALNLIRVLLRARNIIVATGTNFARETWLSHMLNGY